MSRFWKSSVAGYITGIRFYKGSGNTGTHVGHLWMAASTGTLTGTATFTRRNQPAAGSRSTSPRRWRSCRPGQHLCSHRTMRAVGHYAGDYYYFARRPGVTSWPADRSAWRTFAHLGAMGSTSTRYGRRVSN